MSDERTTKQFATLLRCGAAQEVVYVPTAGASRTIKAIIDRQGTDAMAAPENPLRPHIVATVLNDPVNGIAKTELASEDHLTVPTDAGGTATTSFSIATVTDEDDQILTLELR